MDRVQLKASAFTVLMLLIAAITLTAQRTNDGVRLNGGSTTFFGNGTSSDPSISFIGSKFDGFYWISPGHFDAVSQGNPLVDFGTGLTLAGQYSVGWSNGNPVGTNPDIALTRAAAGAMAIGNGATIGSRIKVDALPTVASGFGTSPSITAGSTPFAGSINVGTGAPGTGGVINFNGTAFPSAPFVVCQDDSSLLVVRCTTTTTQLTIAATALTASDIVSWIAVSSR